MTFPAPNHFTGTRGVWRGATFRRRVTWAADGVPVSLAGKTIEVVIDGVATLTIGSGVTVVDEAGGVFEFVLSAVQTAAMSDDRYSYVVKITAGADVRALLAGSIEARSNVP